MYVKVYANIYSKSCIFVHQRADATFVITVDEQKITQHYYENISQPTIY